MLKADELKKNPLFTGITDEQWKGIETASYNDEQVIGNRKMAEIYADRDKDIFDAFGIEKLKNDLGEPFEKNTAYFKRVLDLKVGEATKATNAKLTKLEAEKAEIEKKIESGEGNEAMAKKLKDKDHEIETWKTKYQTDIEAKTKELQEKDAKVKETAARAELDKGKIGLIFKADEQFPKADRDLYINSVDQAILNEFSPDIDENGKTIWRDKKGEIVRNPNNLNEPITINDIYAERLKPVLDGGRKLPGGGTGKPEPIKGANGVIQVVATSKVAATDQITKYLLSNGVAVGTPEFDTQFKAIKEANPQIEALPFKE